MTGIELKCTSIDYDTADGNFFAAGPGLIKVDNSQTDEPQEKLGKFSLRRKCYAFLRNFDSLAFAGQSKHLTADSKDGSLLVDYLPLVEGRGSEKVSVTASHVEADIAETLTGRMELRDLLAKGAVTYEDKDTQVVGSEFYLRRQYRLNRYPRRQSPPLQFQRRYPRRRAIRHKNRQVEHTHKRPRRDKVIKSR